MAEATLQHMKLLGYGLPAHIIRFPWGEAANSPELPIFFMGRRCLLRVLQGCCTERAWTTTGGRQGAFYRMTLV